MRITTLTAAAAISVLGWEAAQAQPLCSDAGPERVTTVTTRRTVAWNSGFQPAPIGERIAYRRSFVTEPALEPVGERIYTRRYIARPAPIGERIVTRRTVTTTRTMWQQPAPIAERVVTRRTFVSDPGLEPVGERLYTRRYFARPALEPIGERVYTQPVATSCAAEPIGERMVTRRTVTTTTTVGRPLPIGEQLDGTPATLVTHSTLGGRRDVIAPNAVLVNDGGRARAVWTDDAGVVHSLPVRSLP